MDQPLPAPDPSVPPVSSPSLPPVSTSPHTSYVPKLLVVAVLFLTLGLGAGFTLNNYLSTPNPTPTPVITTSPAPDPTANWKTYTDDKFKFSIKYPSNWTISPQVVKDGNWTSATLLLAYSPGTIMQEGEPSIEMEFSVNALKPAVYNIDKQALSYSKDFGGEPSEIETYKIGTFQGKTISVKGSVGNIDRKAVFIEKNNLIYHIDLLWKSGKQDFETNMDQILSTFKFGGTTNSDNSNWKTYTNKALSFKYPANWITNGPFVLTGTSPSIRIAVSENSTLMNECMQETSVENKTGFVLRKFKRVVTGEACSGGDASELETWVVKSADSFGPGIIITYSANDSALANPIINNILSTFKFSQ